MNDFKDMTLSEYLALRSQRQSQFATLSLWMDEQAARTELTTIARELGMGVRKDDDSDDTVPSEAQLLAFALRVVKMAKLAVLDECLTALAESRADIATGRYVIESAAEHVARVQRMVAVEAVPAGGSERPAP